MKGRALIAPTAATALLAGVCLALSLTGCRIERDGLEPQAKGPGACAGTCHGNGDSPAPPSDLQGNVAPSAPGVGAHAAHMKRAGTHARVECRFCHHVPETTGEPGHADDPLPAEVVFSELATQGDRSPTYDRTTGTCSDSYCHAGARSKDAWPSNAVWTAPRDAQGACGFSCHALPPGGSHPKSTQCELCHAETAGPDHTIAFPEKHVDGTLQLSVQGCSGCHGNDDNAAPPRDLEGGSDTNSVTVGAHQAHLSGGDFSRPVECEACHIEPSDVGDPGHTDSDSPAEVVFGDIATTGGASPSWDRTSATCTASYCHGSQLSGGTHPTPIWTRVDGSQDKCGSCHALPPPPPHVANQACNACHTPTAGPALSIATRDTHIDGILTIPGGPCNQCHGDDTLYAPPRDLAGNTDTSSPGVGAHRQHLDPNEMSFAKPFACDVCHPVPPLSTSHMNGVDDLVFTGIAIGTVDGAPVAHQSAPSYDSSTLQCSNVYCHGGWTEASNPSGASVQAPVWNQVDGSQAKCGSCHGLPPPPPHPPSASCQNCHPAVVDDQLQLIDLSKHINGRVDFN